MIQRYNKKFPIQEFAVPSSHKFPREEKKALIFLKKIGVKDSNIRHVKNFIDGKVKKEVIQGFLASINLSRRNVYRFFEILNYTD